MSGWPPPVQGLVVVSRLNWKLEPSLQLQESGTVPEHGFSEFFRIRDCGKMGAKLAKIWQKCSKNEGKQRRPCHLEGGAAEDGGAEVLCHVEQPALGVQTPDQSEVSIVTS